MPRQPTYTEMSPERLQVHLAGLELAAQRQLLEAVQHIGQRLDARLTAVERAVAALLAAQRPT